MTSARLPGVASKAQPTLALRSTPEPYREVPLRLRLLSTFRGNRYPLLLTAEGEADGAVAFRAERPECLRVQVKADDRDTALQVLHRERLRVEIHLARR